MKRIALALVVVLLLPIHAQAFSTKDFLSLVAMPLAVAAVSDFNGVSQNDLASVVTNLNRAEVPPTEFVQVVRYVPVALVSTSTYPPPSTFVEYVDQQTASGISGPRLVTVIDERLVNNYGVTPFIDPNAPVVVVDNNFFPDVVVTRLNGSSFGSSFDGSSFDPLALTAMPLAVAAVSEVIGIPQDQLASLVATLNQANVPPAQFVEVVRYAPVAITYQQAPQPFVPFVQTQFAQGITGPALVTVIDERFPTFGVSAPRIRSMRLRPQPARIVVDEDFVPRDVRARIARSEHPHGGPPGQIKKIEGLQTGAEVVHGHKPGRQFIAQPQPPVIVQRVEGKHEHHGRHGGLPPGQAKKIVPPPPMSSAAPPMVVPPQPPPGKGHGEGHGADHDKGHGKEKEH